MSLAWIASYPKSGNTWVRIMLLSYLDDRPLDMGRIKPVPANPATVDLAEMLSQGILWPPRREGLVTAKTHFLPGVDVHRPYRKTTSKVLYVVRNPRDVIHSAERFLYVSPAHRTAFARHFVDHQGFEGWRRTGFGTWAENVSEWASAERYFPDADVCVIRYEDLKGDAAGSLSRIVGFLGLDDGADAGRIARAVRNSKLDRLREQERRINTPEHNKNPFFGRGLSGQSLVDYGADVEESYLRLLDEDSAFADLAKRYGYTE